MIIMTGPTGVGKSDFALSLAQKILDQQVRVELINGDIGQCYTPLTIGTAKPDWRTQKIPHHLFDIIDQPVNRNVVDFCAQVRATLQEIRTRKNCAILVGGSSFYVHALLYPPQQQAVSPKRSYIQETQDLWQELYLVDPVRAQEIKPGDRYRIMRALDIWHAHAQKPSVFKPVFAPVQVPVALIVITREREELYKRINARVDAMFAAGWVDEVAALSPAWQEFLLAKKFIGYDDIVKFLRVKILRGTGVGTVQELKKIIAQKTRAYAKRQLTFNRMMTKKVEEHRDSVYTEWVTVAGDDYEISAQGLFERLREKGYGGK